MAELRRAVEKIVEGLEEALAVVKGEAEPHSVTEHCPTCGQPIRKAKFDRTAYQREYMRRRRAKKPAAT